ncbi:MAG TPA: hypothetical protein PLS49_02375, partial [Candidatus Woesebacteria bacterium]|nr:hypothetical protein [Candidatus Woesebacteria bacterium]
QSFLQNYFGHTVLMTFPKMRNFPYQKIEYTVNQYQDRTDLMYLSDIYTNKELYYKNDYHPTAKGHKVIAADVYNYLTENNIIPCH